MHLRVRLSDAEAETYGLVVRDVRGTAEYESRVASMVGYVPDHMLLIDSR